MSENSDANPTPEPSGADAGPPIGSLPVPPLSVIGDPPEVEADASALAHPVVGLGAAAGGPEAYVELIETLAPDTGMSFVVVPNLAEYDNLPELLSRHTKLPVVWIEGGEQPQPNTIHVLPPDKQVTITNGHLLLEQKPADGRQSTVIDRFFRSLASDQKNHALGVLLSGAEADGALGLKTIKGEGGVAIAQDPATARFAAMPRTGIMADHVDLILPPAEIGRELTRLARRFVKREFVPLEQGALPAGDEPHFTRILALLRGVSGIDFRLYKSPTIRRRIGRRMMLRKIESLADYAAFLHNNPDELPALQEDLLINVTRFFRDPGVFQALKTDVLPRLFDNRPAEEQVRVWVAGCSTGEEAYSIAICLVEYLSGQVIEPSIQIFGTDASDLSIERARTGIYPETIAADVSPERLRRFFVKVDHGYQVSKRVRDLCIFARQNLCNDPPFSRLDLISCRNVLIYLGAEVQHRIITTLHYALRPNAYLLMGNAESIREHGELFNVADRKNKIYVKGTAGIRLLPEVVPRLAPGESYSMDAPAPVRATVHEPELQQSADRIVLARYAPAAVVINEGMEILQVRGRTAPYLEIAPGTASLHLTRMAREGMGPALRDAVQRVMSHGIPVTVDNLSVRVGDELHHFSVHVLPLQTPRGRMQAFLIVFLPASVKPPEFSAGGLQHVLSEGASDEAVREVAKLQHGLSSTRLYLQSLIEERDNRNQELTSAYEELQSANEELQSSNEELETAKEELQSANEELQTVNEELRNRNTALMHAGNDLSNLLNSVNIPVIMLGNDLTIRQFTPPAEKMMRIRRQDIGRAITEIRLNLSIEDIEPLLVNVLDTLATREIDVQDSAGRWHLLRIRPYRTAENRIDGLVLVLLDIDEMRRAESIMREARDFSQSIIEAVPVPFVVLDFDLRVRAANGAFRKIAGLQMEDLDRRQFPELAGMWWGLTDLRPRLEQLRAASSGSPTLEVEHEVPGEAGHVLRLTAHSVQHKQQSWLLVLVEDISSARHAQQRLERERDQLSSEIHEASQALERTKQELRALAARLFTSQEEERRRIARELHDDVSQKLAALDIDMGHFLQKTPAVRKEAEHRVGQLRDRMAALAQDVRKISHALHPSILEDLGLPQALKSLVDDFGEREQMLATFTRRRVPDRLPLEVATTLYRIAQEALRNIAKHAGKTHVKVTLQSIKEGLCMTVRDSGDGFDVTGSSQQGLGLISMQERARLVNGTFRVESELGEGTTVTVIVPLPDPHVEQK